MANGLTSQFNRLVLSAYELKEMTRQGGAEWPDQLVEDYLNILEDLIVVAEAVDGDSEGIEELNVRVTQLETDVSDLQNRVNLLELGQANLNIRVTQNENDIIDLENADIVINSRLDDIEQFAAIIEGA